MAYQGRLSQWNDEKGYGFIEPEEGGDRVFVHIKSFVDRRQRPVGGETLSYQLKMREGRIQADDVEMLDDRGLASRQVHPSVGESGEWRARESGSTAVNRRSGPKRGSLGSALLLPVIFLAGVAGAVYAGYLPWVIPAIYGAVSVVTFLAYAVDKSAAQEGGWRTQESTLHLFALAGGWPGAIVAQQWLRHKSKKAEFRFVFWVTVVFNVAALGWLLSAPGQAFLAEVAGAWQSRS